MVLDETQFQWQTIARSNQKVPLGNWRVWLIMAGRGFGKTRTGAETIREWVSSGMYGRIALIGETIREARDIMVEGVSGILSVSTSIEKLNFESSKRRLSWPNGAVATLYGGNTYNQLRGPQFDAAWVDEIAKFKDPEALWDQLMMCMRIGNDPKIIVTTTPRPLRLLQNFLKDDMVHVTRGSTFDNRENLATAFFDQIVKKYEGTHFGIQELEGELLTDLPGALWQRNMIRRGEILGSHIDKA